MDIPGFFSEKEKILNYDYQQIEELLDSKYDESYWIENLSIDKPNLVSKYFQSILLGYNHLYILFCTIRTSISFIFNIQLYL